MPTKMAENPQTPQAGAQGPAQQNVFTELFGDDKVAKPEAAVMNTVLKKEETGKKSFFSKLKPSAKKAEPEVKTKSTVAFGNLILQVAVLLLVVVGVASYTQNAAGFSLFGLNPAGRAELAEAQVLDLNAELTVQQHLTSVLLLDQYSSLADEYFYALEQSESEFISTNKRSSFKNDVAKLEPEMQSIVLSLQEVFARDLSDEDFAAAKDLIAEQISALKAKKGEVDEVSLLEDIQDLESTRKLMQSPDFQATVAAGDLEAIWMDYNDINQSVLALINGIKEERLAWSGVLDELERVTKKVDPLFGTEFASNLVLEDVRMDSEGSIIVSGSAVTDDVKNFTLISNFIDTLEQSELFESVEERSYRKNVVTEADEDENYQSSFRITMTLTQDDEGQN